MLTHLADRQIPTLLLRGVQSEATEQGCKMRTTSGLWRDDPGDLACHTLARVCQDVNSLRSLVRLQRC